MDKYVKIVYQTEPIGPEKIILYLTTFDKEAFDRDQLIEKREYATSFNIEKRDLQDNNAIVYLEEMLNSYVKKYYEPKIKELEGLINTKKCMDRVIDLNAQNINNSGDVHCGIVYGNINNCDNIYCTEIKGNVVNCDKIVYK